MKKVAFLLLLIPTFIYGQERKDVDLRTIVDEWITSDEPVLYYDNINVTGDLDIRNYIESKHLGFINYDVAERIILNKVVEFSNCTIETIWLSKISLKGLQIIDSEMKRIFIDSIAAIRLEIGGNKIESAEIVFSNIPITRIWMNDVKNDLSISASFLYNVHITGNTINGQLVFDHNFDHRDGVQVEFNRKPKYWEERFNHIHKVSFFDSSFFVSNIDQNKYKVVKDQAFEIWGNHAESIWIEGNSFTNLYLDLTGNTIGDKLKVFNNYFPIALFQENRFEKLEVFANHLVYGANILSDLDEVVYNIDWEQLRDKIVMLTSDYDSDTLIFQKVENLVSNKSHFYSTAYLYNRLVARYKEIGRIEDANEAYAEWKDLKGARLGYIFKQEGGLENYFKWKLNWLLKVYTNHGTSPALAIVVSFYVILIFAIFYFFFPSEWDVTSKSKLIKDFKDFTQKNDKGYMRPFLSMLLGFIISLINALTLSLNAFTTLGFGRIPTKGLAKYVCVIQGFIGWFLLSIFTVALINQVLA